MLLQTIMAILVLATPLLTDIGSSKGMDAGRMEPDVIVHPSCDRPMYYIENRGQWDRRAIFRANWGPCSTWFTESGIVHSFIGGETDHVIRISFEGSEGAIPVGIGGPVHGNNYIGNGTGSISANAYRSIIYHNVWPGIDILYRSLAGQLKYDIICVSGADPSAVRFRVDGHESIASRGDSIEVRFGKGYYLVESGSAAFDGNGCQVHASFSVLGENTFGFTVDQDHEGVLIIDPLIGSTYIGGSSDDSVIVDRVDDEGYIYMAGDTTSSDYPKTTGAVQEGINKWFDVFVTKMVPNGSAIVFSTYLGGSNMEWMGGLALDNDNNIFITGQTNSIDFPTTVGAFQETNLNTMYSDIYISKLNSSGDRLLYSTYISGDWYEYSYDIDILDGCAAICGQMESHDFPSENGPVGGVHGTAFYLLMDRNGTSIQDSFFWDTGGSEKAVCMDIDLNGDVVIGGTTSDPGFPVTPGAYTSNPATMVPPLIFISKYSPSANGIAFTSLMGGQSTDYITDLKTDGEGNIYFTGLTYGWKTSHFPTTSNAYDRILNGTRDGILAKLSGTGTTLLFSTLFGGDGSEYLEGLTIDSHGCPWVVGHTDSDKNFTVTENCLDDSFGGEEDAIVARFSTNGSTLLYSTFYGGSGADNGLTIGLPDHNEILIAGSTTSLDLNVTSYGFQVQNMGGSDGFVAVFDLNGTPTAPSNLTVFQVNGSVLLEWDPPESDGGKPVTNYRVFRGVSIDNMSEIALIGYSHNHNDIPPELGVEFFYGISCINDYGEGPMCVPLGVIPLTAPTPPMNLRAIPRLNNILLLWEDPESNGGSPIMSYRIFRIGPDNNTKNISSVKWPEHQYPDVEIDDATVYSYSVTAWNGYGVSMPSTVVARSNGIPLSPENLTYTYEDGAVILHWDPPSDLMGLDLLRYNVYASNGTGSKMIGWTGPNTTSLEIRTSNGVVLSYWVTAQNLKGESTISNVLQAHSRTVPTHPLNLIVVWSEGSMVLRWSLPETDGGSPLRGYRVYFTPVGGEYRLLAFVPPSGPDLQFNHPIPFSSEVRSYYITAENSEGESFPSAVVASLPPRAPRAPLGLEAEFKGEFVILNWTAPSSDGGSPILGYEVLRSSGQEDRKSIALIAPSSTSILDGPMEFGSMISYTVRAYNIAGFGEEAGPVSVRVLHPLGPIRGLRAVGEISKVVLVWDPPTSDGGKSIIGYSILRSEGTNGALMEWSNSSSGNFTDTLVKKGIVYSYVVCPITIDGQGPMSETVSAIPIGPPGPPARAWAFVMDGTVILRWSIPFDDGGSVITHYVVERVGDVSFSAMVEPSSLEYIDRNTTIEGMITYRIVAFNVAGESTPLLISLDIPDEAEDKGEPKLSPWLLAFISIGALLALAIMIVAMRRKKNIEEDIWGE